MNRACLRSDLLASRIPSLPVGSSSRYALTPGSRCSQAWHNTVARLPDNARSSSRVFPANSKVLSSSRYLFQIDDRSFLRTLRDATGF